MDVKLMQMYRLIQHMHDRKGDRLVSRIDDQPDILLREVDLAETRSSSAR